MKMLHGLSLNRRRAGVSGPADPAPVISGFTISDAGAGAGNVTLATDIDCTAYFWIGPTGTTPTASEVRNGTGATATFSQAVTTTGGPYSPSLPAGLNGNYRVSVVGQVGAGALSNVETQSPVAFDTLAATLSSPTTSSIGTTSVVWGVTSTEAGGTIYVGARPSGGAALTSAQLIAGAGGTGVSWGSDASPTADSANGGTLTGLTASTAYRIDMVQVDSVGNTSPVISSDEFTTAAAITTSFAHVSSTRVARTSGSAADMTFSGLSIGAEDANRRLLVVVSGLSSDNFLPTTVRFGASTFATKLREVQQTGGVTLDGHHQIWEVSLPTGTTSDVTLTFGGSVFDHVVSIYRCVANLITETAWATDNTTTAPLTVSLNTATDGHVIGAAICDDGSAWTTVGLTENYDADIRTTDFLVHASAAGVAAETPRTVTFSCTDNGTRLRLAAAFSFELS